MNKKVTYYFIGLGLIILDLIILAQGIFVAQIVQTINISIGGSGFTDFYMYFPKSIIAILVVILLIALYVGYYIPINMKKDSQE